MSVCFRACFQDTCCTDLSIAFRSSTGFQRGFRNEGVASNNCSPNTLLTILRFRPCRRPLYLGLSLLGYFSNFSAEMCAASLVSRCIFYVTRFTIHADLGRGCCQFWNPKRMIWHACCIHFGTLGDHRAIQRHLGAQGGRPWGPGFDLCFVFGASNIESGASPQH